MLIRDAALKKLKVLSKDGRQLGEVSGMEVDTESFKVAALFLRVDPEVGKDAGVKKPLIGKAELRVEIAKVSGIGDAVVLEIDATSLSKL